MTSKEFSEISCSINTKVRAYLKNKYGTDTWSMQDKCIEATDILVAEYNKHPGIKAKAKEFGCYMKDLRVVLIIVMKNIGYVSYC